MFNRNGFNSDDNLRVIANTLCTLLRQTEEYSGLRELKYVKKNGKDCVEVYTLSGGYRFTVKVYIAHGGIDLIEDVLYSLKQHSDHTFRKAG